MEEKFGLRAGVVEDEGGAVARHLVQDRGDGIATAAAAPWWGVVGVQHGNVGVGARVGLQNCGLGGEEAGEGGGVLNRGRKADAAEGGVQRLQAGDLEDELVAAFAFGEGVDFVDDNPLQALENSWGVFVGEEEGEAFRRGQQDVRRVGALFAALGVGGVAGAILHPDLQGGTFNGGAQVAADVGGEGLEGGDVEGVEACRRVWPQFREGGEESGEGLAASGRGDEEGGGVLGPLEHVKLVGVEGPAFGGEPVGKGGGESDHD